MTLQSLRFTFNQYKVSRWLFTFKASIILSNIRKDAVSVVTCFKHERKQTI